MRASAPRIAIRTISTQTVDSISQERVDAGLALVREMGERFGEILAGSETEARASEFLVEQMERLGLEVETHVFPAVVSHPGPGTLELLGSTGEVRETVPCAVFAQSEPTPPEGLEAEILHVGPGGLDDYASDAAVGKIILAELSYSPPRPEKARIAKARGAAGLLLANWGQNDSEVVPRGTVKSVWGNPTRRDLDEITTLPAVGISRAAGIRLRDAARRGTVRVRLHTEVDRAWRDVRLPMGWLRAGRAPADEFVLVGGHYDSWGGAITDNFTGNIGSLLVVESLMASREQLRRDVALAFWPAHESGIMGGSTWFADRFWDVLRDGCVAYLNLDSIGMVGTSVWDIEAAAELEGMIRAAAERHRQRPLQYGGRVAKTGDQSFLGLGIPSLVARSQLTPEEVRELHGAVLGWWYHSDHDTFDKVDRNAFAYDVDVFVDYARLLTIEPILPLRSASVAHEIDDRLTELTAAATGAGLDLDATGMGWSALTDAAKRLIADCERLDGTIDALRDAGDADAEAVTAANRWLRTLGAVTAPVRYAAVHRHDQDRYGRSNLRYTLPELDVVREYAGASEDQSHVLWTEMARARNRVADAVHDALQAADAATQALGR